MLQATIKTLLILLGYVTVYAILGFKSPRNAVIILQVNKKLSFVRGVAILIAFFYFGFDRFVVNILNNIV